MAISSEDEVALLAIVPLSILPPLTTSPLSLSSRSQVVGSTGRSGQPMVESPDRVGYRTQGDIV